MKTAECVKDGFSLPGARRFRRSLLDWYDLHRRDLPWRVSRDPYRVWLSEIMLQQTRVAAVVEHYKKFLGRFPTVQKLAAAREASVLAAWSGLGYYRRARMLHAAAKVVVRESGGKFPASEERLRALPGIGRYTAAAIASIAFAKPVGVVDGNVERVLGRVVGKRLAGEELWTAANRVLEVKRPGDFNQAMMELGAVVCTPRAPACLICPVAQLCATQGELPVEAQAMPQQKRDIHYALHSSNGKVLLVQRPRHASLMPGMWELPEVEGTAAGANTPRNSFSLLATGRDDDANGKLAGTCMDSFTLRHSITTTDYRVRVWRNVALAGVDGRWIPTERLTRVALTGLARKILRKAQMLG